MSGKRYLLLEVDETRAAELLAALRQRSYIKPINLLAASDRSRFDECPACRESLSKPTIATVTEHMVYGCLSILQAMRISKTAVVYNHSLIKEVRPVDHQRAVPFPYKYLYHARLLGIIDHFLDGSQETFFVTTKGMDFLRGDEELSPARVTVVKNVIIESGGTIALDDVKRKDVARFSETVIKLREAIKALPETTMQFVKSGQVPLLK